MLTSAELVWLLAAVAKGDEAAFERLYAATRAKLYGVILRIVRRHDLADEVVQEAYLKVWSGAGRFDPALSSPLTWMVAVARNQAIDLVRKMDEPIEEQPEAMEVAARGPDPLTRRDMTDELKRLLGCIGRLEPDSQRLVLLAYYNGLSREQLAEKLGATLDSIKVRLRRGLAEICGCLGLMNGIDDHDALAAEYVLGPLDRDERTHAQALLESDDAFAEQVRRWEERLGGLNVMVDAVEPPSEIWERIRARIGKAPPPEGMRLPPLANQTVRPEAGNGSGRHARRSGSVSRWRDAALVLGALAGLLIAFLALSEFRPDLVPAALRPGVGQVQSAANAPAPPAPAAPSAPSAGRHVAVLQKDASVPGFVVTVDLDNRTLVVRRLAAELEPGKSFELWLVSDKLSAPRSLGVVGSDEFTKPPTLAAYDRDMIDAATYAVSLEPEGGSPTGAPTGPVLYLGKLFEATPAAAAP